jgi:hypothetical protein
MPLCPWPAYELGQTRTDTIESPARIVAQASLFAKGRNPSRVRTCGATERLAKSVFSAKGRGIHLKAWGNAAGFVK